MSFAFDYGGLLIGSLLDLHGLPRAVDGASRDPDIAIRLDFGALPQQRPVSHVWKGRYGLVLERGGRADHGWTIRYRDAAAIECAPDGAALDCTCRGPNDVAVLGELLARRVLPRLTSLHGRMPVHAASLARDGGAVLLFGTSGAGKSTMTAAAAANGWHILSDDMSILNGGDDTRIWQTAPGVSLWTDSKEALGLPPGSCRPIEGYDGKFWFSPPGRRIVDPVPLNALIFLSAGDPGSALGWTRLPRARAMMAAAAQMVRFDPGDVAENAAAMDKFSRLVSNMPSYILHYPRDYSALPDALDQIAAIQNDARQTAL